MFSKKGEKKVWFREMIADRKWAERGKYACVSAVGGSPVCRSSVALRCASSSLRGENFPKLLPWIIRYQQAVIYENTVKYVEASRQRRRKARLKPLKSSVTVRDRKLSVMFLTRWNGNLNFGCLIICAVFVAIMWHTLRHLLVRYDIAKFFIHIFKVLF